MTVEQIATSVIIVLVAFLIIKHLWKKDIKIDLHLKGKIHFVRGYLVSLIQKMTLTSAVAITVVLFLFIPDKFTFAVTLGFCLFIFDLTFKKLVGRVIILIPNFNKEDVKIFQITETRLRDYNIIDRSGQKATLQWWFNSKEGRVFIADDLNPKTNTIVVNPICCSLDFARNYKENAEIIIKKANSYLHQLILAKSRIKHDVKLEAINLLEALSDIDQYDIDKEDTEKEEDL